MQAMQTARGEESNGTSGRRDTAEVGPRFGDSAFCRVSGTQTGTWVVRVTKSGRHTRLVVPPNSRWRKPLAAGIARLAARRANYAHTVA